MPALLLALVLPLPVVAQGGPASTAVRVRVRQVAGANLYLDVGSDHGLLAGDTVRVARVEEAEARVVGALRVVAATGTRSVLTFAGEPFRLTRGDELILMLLRTPSLPPPEPGEEPPPGVRPEAAPPPAGPGLPTRGPARERRAPSGSVTLDVTALRSATEFGGADPEEVERTFATPSLRLDLTVPDLAGGFRFRTRLRAAYRYSDRDVIPSPGSTRIHQAVLERTGRRTRVHLGRFYSPVESYSGYWDGVFLRVGGGDLGVGALVGFQPERWNEGPSGDLPKATAFVDARRDGEGWRWEGDLSAHTVRPRTDLPDRSFVGMSQSLRVRGFRADQDLQVDREPGGSGWTVSRLRLRAGLQLTSSTRVRAGFRRRTPYRASGIVDLVSSARERWTAGLTYAPGRGYVGGDVSLSRNGGDRESRAVTLSFGVPGLFFGGRIGLTGTGSYWGRDDGHVLTLGPGLTGSVGSLGLRAAYRLYRSDLFRRVRTTHTGELGLSLPLGRGLHASARFRAQRGGGLGSELLHLKLAKRF